MAHPEQRQFCKRVCNALPSYFVGKRVLEVGSLNINGTIRDLFKNCSYTGIDVHPGKDVDIVCQGKDFVDQDGFDTIVSTECFEHDQDYVLTVQNILKLLRPGGLFFFTCASINRHEHGTRRTETFDQQVEGTSLYGVNPDYYRNLVAYDFKIIPGFIETFLLYFFEYNRAQTDLYFVGIKNG